MENKTIKGNCKECQFENGKHAQTCSQVNVYTFLRESNAIEGVYDEASLDQALVAWKYLIGEKEINAHVMLRTHKILMLNKPGLYPNEKGYFRTVPVFIAGKQGINAKLIPTQIANLVMNMNDLWINGMKENRDYLEKLIIEHHVKYEKIHPFVDGNGRTGRMFLNWTRVKLGLPILVIKAAERQEYYKWFK